MPSGGVRGVAGVVSIVSGKDGELPLVILDADGSGKSARDKLQALSLIHICQRNDLDQYAGNIVLAVQRHIPIVIIGDAINPNTGRSPLHCKKCRHGNGPLPAGIGIR